MATNFGATIVKCKLQVILVLLNGPPTIQVLRLCIWSVIFGELQVRRSEHTDRFISFVFIYTFVLLSPGIGNSSPVLSDAPRCPDFECLDRELHGRLGHQWLWSGQS